MAPEELEGQPDQLAERPRLVQLQPHRASR
jgi:hypothetical protein